MILIKIVKRILQSVLKRSPSLWERSIHDIVLFPIQDHAYLAVYWKDLKIGKGPGLSLYVYEKEILRFDCFGEDRGHYHTHPNQPNLGSKEVSRIYFSQRTIEDQVKQSIFEVQKNAVYYVQKDFDPKIAFFKMDATRLEAACREANAKMLEYAGKF